MKRQDGSGADARWLLRVRRCAAGLLLASLMAVAGGSLLGCVSSGPSGEARLASAFGGDFVALKMPITAYAYRDANSADLYFTDLSAEALEAAAEGDDLTGIAGHFLHVHLFLVPEAGLTPIDSSACSVILRHVIIADGELGMYGGGGFMFVSGDAGDETFGGSIDNATMRLIAATESFDDRLGHATFSGQVRAMKDEATATELGRQFAAVLRRFAP
ncbi:MAG: hypothetical protein SFZ23_05110 [Planctomycetota bacterium]|nr:hypothetical protein [Planctomycetota bacterium]